MTLLAQAILHFYPQWKMKELQQPEITLNSHCVGKLGEREATRRETHIKMPASGKCVVLLRGGCRNNLLFQMEGA